MSIHKATHVQVPKALDDEETCPSFDLIALNHPRSEYSADVKISVVTYYVTSGSATKAAKHAGIPVSVVNSWKNSAAWWDEAVNEVKVSKNEELEAVMTHALHRANEEIIDRLEHGNEVLIQGELHRVKVPARELSQLTSVLFEKRAMLRGCPTKIANDKKIDFSDLVSQFKQFSKEMREEKVVN